MVECFDVSHNACTLTAHCQLKKVFKTALQSYLTELDKVTLADVTQSIAKPGAESTVRFMPKR
jgi:Rrf2 family transcriptional regulator, nitric oxide-sensitive transcriptional repressor